MHAPSLFLMGIGMGMRAPSDLMRVRVRPPGPTVCAWRSRIEALAAMQQV